MIGVKTARARYCADWKIEVAKARSSVGNHITVRRLLAGTGDSTMPIRMSRTNSATKVKETMRTRPCITVKADHRIRTLP